MNIKTIMLLITILISLSAGIFVGVVSDKYFSVDKCSVHKVVVSSITNISDPSKTWVIWATPNGSSTGGKSIDTMAITTCLKCQKSIIIDHYQKPPKQKKFKVKKDAVSTN